LIPVGGPIRQTGTRRVLVAGDAGGFVNGFSGEGIHYAMVSGELAATAVADALAKRLAADTAYRGRWKAEIGAELEESVALRRRVVRRNPAVGIVLGAILLGKRLEATRHAVFQSEHL
jgi:flavin-dependent dehydrogenase